MKLEGEKVKLEKYDVVVIGAGPAGLSAAQVLAESGKDVPLLFNQRDLCRKFNNKYI